MIWTKRSRLFTQEDLSRIKNKIPQEKKIPLKFMMMILVNSWGSMPSIIIPFCACAFKEIFVCVCETFIIRKLRRPVVFIIFSSLLLNFNYCVLNLIN